MTFGGNMFEGEGLETSGFDDTSPLGNDTTGDVGDLAAFLTTGDRNKLPPVPTSEQQRAAEVENLLASPFSDEEVSEEEEEKPNAATPWLDELLGEAPAAAPKQAQEAQQTADPTEPPVAQIDPELLNHLRAGGDPEEFYRKKFAAVSGGGFGSTAPTQPAPTQPAPAPVLDPEVAEIQTAKTALSSKLRENYLATMQAQQFGTQDDVNALVDESVRLQMEAGELASRERGVLQRTRQTQIQSVSQEYGAQFTDMLKRNHGVSDEARLRAASGKVLEVDWLRALMENEKTFPLMQNEVVREIMVKAALYDMQYSGKRSPARAASDPGVTATNGANRTAAPKRASPAAPTEMTDKDFTSFMTGGKKK